jgi:hypothetical protein
LKIFIAVVITIIALPEIWLQFRRKSEK